GIPSGQAADRGAALKNEPVSDNELFELESRLEVARAESSTELDFAIPDRDLVASRKRELDRQQPLCVCEGHADRLERWPILPLQSRDVLQSGHSADGLAERNTHDRESINRFRLFQPLTI